MALSFLQGLLVASWTAPLVLCVLWVLPRGRPAAITLVPWSALPAVGLGVLSAAGWTPEPIALPMLFTGMQFALDPVGQAFLVVTALLWLACAVFAVRYHAEDPRRSFFFLFFLLTMAGNLGLVVSGDLLSFYLFFALMTFAAYGLIVHAHDAPAMRAGRVYIILALLGEVALLSGLLSLGAVVGGIPLFGSEIEGAWALLEGGGPAGLPLLVTAFLLAIGFGVKAGIAPLHLWLPLAHPVAPTATSALLSGAMIKAGLLGWIRVLPHETALPLLGGAFLLAGAASAVYGVVMGIAQDDSKTVLAYSSVSQMGYMAIGVGVMVLSPATAPVALAGVALFAMHHGLAKGALFLSVGVADRLPARSSGEADGDRYRRWILVGAALPALALAGLPLTSGALAKSALKAGISDLGGLAYAALDPLLPITAFGTTLLMARFLVTLDQRRQRVASHDRAHDRPHDRASPQAGAAGLVLPWAGLILLGGFGVLWLPTFRSSLASASGPSLLYGWAESLIPVLAGSLLGWMIARRPGRLGRIRSVRVPAGDLLVPIEQTLARLPRPDQNALLHGLRTRLLRALRPFGSQLRSHAHLLNRDTAMIDGARLGVFLLVLTLMVCLALSL